MQVSLHSLAGGGRGPGDAAATLYAGDSRGRVHVIDTRGAGVQRDFQAHKKVKVGEALPCVFFCSWHGGRVCLHVHACVSFLCMHVHACMCVHRCSGRSALCLYVAAVSVPLIS